MPTPQQHVPMQERTAVLCLPSQTHTMYATQEDPEKENIMQYKSDRTNRICMCTGDFLSEYNRSNIFDPKAKEKIVAAVMGTTRQA